MVYSSILGGRLIGIGINSIALYQASMNIQRPPNPTNFIQAQSSILRAPEYKAIESMTKAKIGLCDLYFYHSTFRVSNCIISCD